MIGTWFMTGSPQVMSILRHNLDFVIIDMEHGNIENNDLLNLINAGRDMEAVWVRPRTNTLPDIQQVFDAGPTGIILPHIETKEEVLQFIRNCQYPPNGQLGYSPFTPMYGYHPGGIIPSLNCAIIIESQTAVRNLESILTVPELDMIYIGVYDLSKDYGIDLGSDQMASLFDYIAKMAMKYDKELGAIYGDAESKKYLEKYKVQWMVYKTDTAIIYDATKGI